MRFHLKVLSATTVTMLILTQASYSQSETDLLVKLKEAAGINSVQSLNFLPAGSRVEDLGLDSWVRVEVPSSEISAFSIESLEENPAVAYVQPNYPIRILDTPGMASTDKQIQRLVKKYEHLQAGSLVSSDNPPIPPITDSGSGSDPLLGQQWGMTDSGAASVWGKNQGQRKIVVAVLDTGVDYTHEDLRGNMWRNPGESGVDSQGRAKDSNGIDDDRNGYVDDLVGWDFVSNDNKPYDLAFSGEELLLGGNPGHGTHCAGNVAAMGSNGKGISGVAPRVSIMAVRFLSERGQGTTADAIKSIKYAIDSGAHVLSNSWGSEGEAKGAPENEALKDVIRYSEKKGVLFVAAAGNGHEGTGYDNDNDARPAYPASYDMNIIISVAALDAKEQLGSFSNWGSKSVDIGAPGVNIFSTTVGSNYSDKILEYQGQSFYWSGTSMATPYVAGAAALYLSQKPNAPWREIKDAILKTATAVPSLRGKSVSNGKLNIPAMLNN